MTQHRLNYHHLISHSTVSAAGPLVVNAVVDAQSQLYYRYLPGFRRASARRPAALPVLASETLFATRFFPAVAWVVGTARGG
jgi:hypothetical protein